VSTGLNASQAGPSYGASPQTWRSSCVDSFGLRVACEQPFAVCGAIAPYTISTQCFQLPDLSWDCDCGDGGRAISGGAYAGPLAMLNASEAGPQFNFGKQWWHVSCSNRTGAAVSCEQPFAVCAPF
jgi:hypothetical protein